MFDVHIVGAGPAGSFAGIAALKKGASPLISEEHENAGVPAHCSGLISASALEQLANFVDYKKAALNSINRANFICKKNSFAISYAMPKAYVIDRSKFDSLAMQKYLDMGGKAEFNSKIKSISCLKSKNIIGADGPISTVARIFNFAKIPSYFACWQGEFSHSCQNLHAVDVYMGPDIAPGFIAWVIPISKERAKIGLGVCKGENIFRAKKAFLHRLEITCAPHSSFGAFIPAAVRPKTSASCGGYNVLLAGDSAGQAKPTTGGGVFFGAKCGYMAGENFSNPAEYEKQWRSKYLLDLRLHSALRLAFDSLSPDGIDAWMAAVKLMKINFLLEEIGEMDQYSKMLSVKALGAYTKVLFSRR